MTDLPASQRCQGRKRNGDPCGSAAMTDGTGFCFQHNPDIPASVKLDASRLGGLAHRQNILPDLEAIALKRPKDAKKLLARMVKHLLGGSLTTSRANSAGFLLRVLAELEGLTRRKEDLHVGITVSFTTLNREGEETGREATPAPPLAPVKVPRVIAPIDSTSPQALPSPSERSEP